MANELIVNANFENNTVQFISFPNKLRGMGYIGGFDRYIVRSDGCPASSRGCSTIYLPGCSKGEDGRLLPLFTKELLENFIEFLRRYCEENDIQFEIGSDISSRIVLGRL